MDATNGQDGRLEAIWIKRIHGGPMTPATSATLVVGKGLADSASHGGTRQVTVIEREVFEGLRSSLDPAVDPSMRRANLMVSGVRLEGSRRHTLRIGSCRIELVGETRPCSLMDDTLQGLRQALEPNWGGGAYGRVVVGGEIHVGDEVRLEPAAQNDALEPGLTEVEPRASRGNESGDAPIHNLAARPSA
jgi:MOSC domain-containing protein YiiM